MNDTSKILSGCKEGRWRNGILWIVCAIWKRAKRNEPLRWSDLTGNTYSRRADGVVNIEQIAKEICRKYSGEGDA